MNEIEREAYINEIKFLEKKIERLEFQLKMLTNLIFKLWKRKL